MILPAAQGATAWIHTGTFMWPHGSGPLAQSIGGLLTGHPGRGLPPNSGRVPSAVWVYSLIAVAELLLISATVWAVVWWWHQLGPRAALGMASRAETEAVLGESNLMRRRALIRPDLESAGREADLP